MRVCPKRTNDILEPRRLGQTAEVHVVKADDEAEALREEDTSVSDYEIRA